ncbi:MAG: sulfite exporter TauE/SafE family protein, partial [Alphaproteobacteria bacterium]|nr:sulfite exporter TauE/SafE family protein [Alphaproteobacteria bacterium]
LGSVIGVRLLARTRASVVRIVVIVLLLAAGSRAILKGLGI